MRKRRLQKQQALQSVAAPSTATIPEWQRQGLPAPAAQPAAGATGFTPQRIGGQGYIPPRRQVGGQHLPYQQRMLRQQQQGYNPATAGGLYGGRPAQVPYQYPRGYQQMNQAQAMTRYQFPASAYIQQPWGGSRAVQRQPVQYPQQVRGWY